MAGELLVLSRYHQYITSTAAILNVILAPGDAL